MRSKAIKVVHMTSAHPRYDIRIFFKECRSLANSGYIVSLVVADGLPDEEKEGVDIVAVTKSDSRLSRMLRTSRRVYKKAIALDADIYHLHDPELLPYAWLLALRGKKVVFDAHEDFPKQLKSKHYLGKITRTGLSWFFGWFEGFICKRLSGVIAATPTITQKFAEINHNSVNVNNYPVISELSSEKIEWSEKEPWVAYIGGIASIRGITEVVNAMELAPSSIILKLGGNFDRASTESECKALAGWERVDMLGFIDRNMVKEVLKKSIAGLVTFHSHPNHVDAQPNKMFEYMSAGVPVIGSHFELWRQVIEGNQCGICVDPMNPREITKAIQYLYENPEKAAEMGLNGQQAIQERYNWDQEQKKLVEFYESL